MTELKPCPFCGGEAQLQDPLDFDDIRGAVMCMSCYITIEDDHWQQAIEKWNNRADETLNNGTDWNARPAELQLVKQLRHALAFAASCIRCGEDWSSTCDEIIGKALEDTRGMQ